MAETAQFIFVTLFTDPVTSHDLHRQTPASNLYSWIATELNQVTDML